MEANNKDKKIKRILFVLIPVALLAAAGLTFIFTRPDFIETVRKETAKIRKSEYIPNQKLDMETRLVFRQRDSLYGIFRDNFRFHYQTLALAHFPDSSGLIVISEPPPYFDMEMIDTIFNKFNYQVETRNHKIGYDGKVTDILISMVNASGENLRNLITRLSSELYLSDYKPYTLNLYDDQKRVYFSGSGLDYQISLSEFHHWFIEEQEPFMIMDDTSGIETIASIFREKKNGIYFSRQPGFVAWAIPRGSDLSDNAEKIRQFTLDADLILGALADSSTLVIIGRERELPLHELPPLNVETVLLLASITEKELSQSLDINDLLAGKMGNGRDWCPTYLSKELENTEFGHLLTITDILLKDWSERGTIKEAYYRYPKPSRYPFDQPLFKKLGLNELVYNWNTANAMYAIDTEEMTIYTLNRTGSLPVSYFNSQERSVSVGNRYENQAYHYFATIGNTDLARVVQYTALYQLFIDNGITYSGDIPSSFPHNKPYLLLEPAKKLLTIFKEYPENNIQILADTLSKIKFNDYQREKVEEQMADYERQHNFIYTTEQRESIHGNVMRDSRRQIAGELSAVKRMLNGLSDENFEKLARYLSYPRGMKIKDRESYNIYLKARQVNQLVWTLGKQHLSLAGLELNDVKNEYVRKLAGSSAPYLKTPSVIITFNDFLTTGGHNLSSKISRVNSMNHYKKSSPTATKTQPSTENKLATPSSGNRPVSTGKQTNSKKTSGSSPTVSSAKAVAKAPVRSRNEVIPAVSRDRRGF